MKCARTRRNDCMATYLLLANWTDQGAKAAASTIERLRQTRAILDSAGVKLLNVYWTLEAYDVVLIVESPDEESLFGSVIRVTASGNLRICTTRAFTETEMRAAIRRSTVINENVLLP